MIDLLINNLSEGEFHDFKKKYLDEGRLSPEAIIRIQELVNTGDSKVGVLSCDEAHGHSYRCVFYHNAVTGIVDRLLGEIEFYKGLVQRIHQDTSVE